MKVTFVSNYLTHHQIPFCDALYKEIGNEFTFISTERMESERINMGWKIGEKISYELQFYIDNGSHDAEKLMEVSDVVIIGSAKSEDLFHYRMKNSKGITFRYSERIYKKGMWQVLSPKGFKNRCNTYFKYYHKPLYLLCASAYTACDMAMLGSYLGRCYKWGYFPQTNKYDIDFLEKSKSSNSILWVGRFIDWKHPEAPIQVAERLKSENIPFTMKIIGTGIMDQQLTLMINEYGLGDYVNILGSVSPQRVREEMDRTGIALMTSDFNEGWGAVVNEAMNSGCAVIASHAMGAVPFLIQHDENGLIYKNGNINDLYSKVKTLLLNQDEQRRLGRNAYYTIINEWNAEETAGRLLKLVNAISQHKNSILYDSGPCSKAEIIGNRWFK